MTLYKNIKRSNPVHDVSPKAAPTSADLFVIADVAGSNEAKQLTGTQVRDAIEALGYSNVTTEPAYTHTGDGFYIESQVGDVDGHTIYDSIYPAINHYDGFRSTVKFSGGTVEHIAALTGYIDAEFAASPNGIALFGCGRAGVDNAAIWGLNTLLQDNTTRVVHAGAGRVLVGAELDFNVMGATTEILGISIGGNSLAQPAVANGFLVNTLGNGNRWETGFWSLDGAADVALAVGADDTVGIEVDSQEIQFKWLDSAGAAQVLVGKVSALGLAGFLEFLATAPWGLSLTGGNLYFNDTYGVIIGGFAVLSNTTGNTYLASENGKSVILGYDQNIIVDSSGLLANGNISARSDSSSAPLIVLENYRSDALSGSIVISKARGTQAIPAAVAQYDVIGRIAANGYVNGAFRTLVSHEYITVAVPSGNFCQSICRWYVDNGTSGQVHTMDFTSDGLAMATGKTVGLASSTVAGLPAAGTAGKMIYATNGGLGSDGAIYEDTGAVWRATLNTGDVVTSVTSGSSDNEVPTAKAVYDRIVSYILYDTTLGAATQNVDIAGLNTKAFEVLIQAVNGDGANAAVYSFYINGDTTAANYHRNYFFSANGAAVVAAEDATPVLGSVTAGDSAFMTVQCMCGPSYLKIISQRVMRDASDNLTTQVTGIVYNAANPAAITSLRIATDRATGLGAGTRIMVRSLEV